MKAAYDRDVAAAYARHGNAGISGAVPTANPAAFQVEKLSN
jgi:hypothetical protein